MLRSEQAYRLRLIGKLWEDVAKEMNTNRVNSVMLAKNYSTKNNLEWPMKVKTKDKFKQLEK